MKRLSAAILACILLLSCGCRSSSQLRKSPGSPSDANKTLEGRSATIFLFQGKTIEAARNVHIGPEVVEYVEDEPRALSISEVARIEVSVDRGGQVGALLGMAPGIALIGIGAGIAVTEPKDSWGQLVAGASIGYGFIGLVGGGFLGGLLGSAVGNRKTYVVYVGTREGKP